MSGQGGRADIARLLQELLARQLGLDPGSIDADERFHRYGLDSAGARSLIQRLGQALGRTLPATVVWDHPTLERLARHLAGEAATRVRPPPVPLAPDEPIAVVGLACRVPGAADPAAFWQLLLNGVDAIREVPAERWPIDRLHDPDPMRPGRMSTRWGGFLDQVDQFDADFFGISPREAAQMDPQQRLALELAWEALEDAGWRPSRLAGRRAGVFLGAMWSDYLRLLTDANDIVQHTATGQDTSIISARISYALGLEGPSLTVNTACSSALVAVHLACQSLRSGESEIVLAGGIHLVLAPESTILMTKFGAMAPDGRCKAFDASANGYVRGEGGGIVALKPLARAKAEGDRIYAVILGSAVNNDGPSNGLTAPNPEAQRAMLDDALAAARIAPGTVDYVEAHGTGTALGDPIEAHALGAVLGQGRDAQARLRIGSVKTNIGHLEAAAGAAGLIKTVLALHERRLPPSLHFHAPSPHIAFGDLGLQVQTGLEDWPVRAHPPTAGVSSFGFGGTNCHVLLRAEPREVATEAAGPVLVFAGNGGVWPGMGRDLLAHAPSFVALVERLDQELETLGCDWRLRDLLGDGQLAHRIEEPAFAQPALFAWQLGVVELLKAAGVIARAVVGHSVGEIAAAVTAGALDEADGLQIVVERSRLQAEKTGEGGMALVLAEPQAVLPLLGREVVIAGRNAPRATLVCGAPDDLDACLARLEANGLTALPVRVPIAYHGPQMEPLRPRLQAALRSLRPKDGPIPFISTVTGGLLAGGKLDAAYWGRNLREPVAFHAAITALGASGHRRFVEIGPHSLLAAAIGQTLPDADALPLTRRGADEVAALATLVDKLGTNPCGAERSGQRARHLLVLSARSEAALWQLADRFAARLPDDFADLCHTALVGRERFAWRLALHAADGLEAKQKLLARDVRTGQVPPDRRPSSFDTTRRAGESLNAYLDRAAAAFVAGDEIDGHDFDAGEPWRVCAAPTYPFQRMRHWLPERGHRQVDPAWLLDLHFLPRPAPGWPGIALTASPLDRERTQALDMLATGHARKALAEIGPARLAARHAALARLMAQWTEPDPAPLLSDGPDLRLLQRLEPHLAGILQGLVEPLDVLFPNGDFAEAARLYAEAPLFAGPARALAQAVRAFAAEGTAPCRILEIGAGTGGLTGHLLDALDGIEIDYLYTDLSPAFLAWGQSRFGARPGFRTGLFDLEADPPAAAFDLVVAANAVHATRDIRASLATAAAQLAPGGYLALVELVRAPRWIDLVFGTTEGWWRHEGDPLRPDHALLDPASWLGLLEQVGLEPVALAEDGDAHAVIVARRPPARSFQVLGTGALAAELAQSLPTGAAPTDLVLVALGEEPAPAIEELAAPDRPPRQWLVHGSNLAQAALRGAFAALALDRPEAIASAIEMQDEDPSSVAALLAELQDGGGEDRVRIEQGVRSVARLLPRQEPLPLAPPVRADRLYVVAGGFGMLGQAFAAWLVEQGARHLLLIGRRVRDSRAIDALRLAGAEIRQAGLDLTTDGAAAGLARLIDRPLGGLVHAAGRAKGDPEVLVADKLAIARTLAKVASDHAPDFLLLASSAAGVWGVRDNPGYAAANAALDAFAQEARMRGLPATSLALGRLAEPGLLDGKEDAALAAFGLEALPLPEVCRTALDAAFAGLPNLVMVRADWRLFLDMIEARRRHSLFDRLRPAPPMAAAAAGPEAAPARRALAGEDLRHLVAELLGHRDPADLDLQRGLFEQGLDSLMALTLRRRLEQLSGTPVPASVLFSHPSIAALEKWLGGREGLRATAGTVHAGTVHAGSQAIAIIGIGCRFPGIHGPEAFAQAIWQGADLISEVPLDRWSNQRWYDPDPTRPGRIASRFGGFIDDVDRFDAGLFGISPREAAQMDPQQRLLLETAWEALENAVIAPDRLAGTATAIYVGATGSDYALLARKAGATALDGHSLTGQPSNTLAGRLAHLLGTEGPAMVLDTACSSSLVAFHQAVQALRSGEAEMALAAGVNLLLAPESSVILSRAGLLAPDGRCKTFDAAANGYVRAEGCGVVVLKPLDRALAAGDPIVAVVRGSAVNHDGRSSGFTAPNGLAQAAVIRSALADAGLEPAEIGMIEAHGTGTRLGDPIELDALGQVFARREAPLLVGSVKTNFGHAEAAAGIAGIIKAALAVGRDSVPPHLHFQTLNPHVARSATPIRVPTAIAPWPVRPARAGVSAFGASGTNAHVVLEAPPPVPAAAADTAENVLLLTGATAEAVREQGRRLRHFLARQPVDFADVCHSMAVGRARLPWWAIARDVEALDRLEPSGGPLPDLPPSHGRRVALPTYPFAKERHWIEVPTEIAAAPLLGPAQKIAGSDLLVHVGRLGHDHDWIRDHAVDGRIILPATGFLALCAVAGAASIRDIELLEQVDVPPSGRAIQLVRKDEGRIELFAEQNESWRLACSAQVALPLEVQPLAPATAWTSVLDAAGHQEGLIRRGFTFGPAFGRIQSLRRTGVLAEAWLGDGPADFMPDPAGLDHGLQTLAVLLPEDETWLPAGIGQFTWSGRGDAVLCRARLDRIEGDVALGDAQLLGRDGQVVASFAGVRFRRTGKAVQNWIHEIRWRPVQADLRPPGPGWHWIEADTGEIPADAAGVVDLRPMVATDPVACLAQTAALVRRLTARPKPPSLLLVSRGAAGAPPLHGTQPPAAAVLMGLVPTIAAEHPELTCRWIDLDPGEEQPPTELLSDQPRLAIRGGIAHAPELVRVAPPPPGPIRLISAGTALSDLALAPLVPVAPGPGEVQVRIQASGLNFKDTLAALGRVMDGPLGLEAAGQIVAVGPEVTDFVPGDPVVLFAPGAHASHLTLKATRCVRCPADLSAACAATLPIAFLTAWHGLIERADLQPGQRVLIHAGAGGVGMAAIQLAVWRGARVFATASPGKQAWARRAGAEATGSSRDMGFVPLVQEWSGGAGVDVVLHALGEEMAQASATLLRPGGSFIELGSAAAPRLPPKARHGRFDLEQPLAADPQWFQHRMTQLFAMLESGAIRPLPRTEMGAEAAGDAMATLAQGRTIGKTVLLWPQHDFRPAGGTWLVTGGTGAVGGAIAAWLADHGAGRVVLAARSRPAPGRLETIPFETIPADIGDRAAVAGLLDALPDLCGIVHAAGVVEDAMVATLSDADIQAAFHAKVEGARHLDELTRERDLAAFIVVSSTVATTGAAGQAAYAAANAWLEGLVRARREAGLPAAAIAFGPWQGGMFEALAAAHRQRLLQQGYRPMAPEAAAAAAGLVLQSGMALRLVLDRPAPPQPVPASRASLRQCLEEAPADARLDLLLAELADRARRLLGFADETRLDPFRALRDLGLDSLLAVSFRNDLAKALALDLPASLAFDYPTLDGLAHHLAALLFPAKDTLPRDSLPEASLPEASLPEASLPEDSLDVLDEDDLALLLASELESPA